MINLNRVSRMRGLLAFWCIATAAVSLTGVAQLGDPSVPGDGGNQWPAQKCSASGSCAGATVPGGVCPRDTSPCCCKIAPATVYVCACQSATFCTTPGAGNHCDDSATP